MFVGFAKVFNVVWHVVRQVASEKHYMAVLLVVSDIVVAVALVTCAVFKVIRLAQTCRGRHADVSFHDVTHQQLQQLLFENLANMQEEGIQENNVIIIENTKRTDTIQDKESLDIQKVADGQESFHMLEKIRTKQHVSTTEYPYGLERGYTHEDVITQDCLRTAEKYREKEKSKMVGKSQAHKTLNVSTYEDVEKYAKLKENMMFMGSVTIEGNVQIKELLNLKDDLFTGVNVGRKILMENAKILNSVNVHQVVVRQHDLKMKNLLKEMEYHKVKEKVKTQRTLKRKGPELEIVKLHKEDTPKSVPEIGKESITTLDDTTTVSKDKQKGIPQKVVEEHGKSIRKDFQDLETVAIEDNRLLVQCMARDGDSLFGVVANKMFTASPGSAEHGKLIRMMRRVTARLLKKNKVDYLKYLLEDVENLASRYSHLENEIKKVDQYLDDLRSSGTPAGVAAIQAIADYYELDIVVYVEPKGQRLIKNSQGKAINEVKMLQRMPSKEESEFVYHFDSVVRVIPTDTSH